MIEYLLEADTQLFQFLNGFHAPWLDQLMFIVSGKWIWIPLYIWFLYLLYRKYNKKQFALMILAIVIGITASDQVASGVLKPLTHRLRPSHEPALASTIHLVNNYKGGKYGFASSHASNTFAIATLLFLSLSETKMKYWWLFLWATIISYSRIYLGVHYPGDVLVGILIGALSGVVAFKLFKKTITLYG